MSFCFVFIPPLDLKLLEGRLVGFWNKLMIAQDSGGKVNARLVSYPSHTYPEEKSLG